MNTTHLPLNDRVIVQRLEDEPTSRLIIKGVTTEKPMRAKVIAVGPGKAADNVVLGVQGFPYTYRHPMSVRPGDTVLIGKYAGTVYEETDPTTFKTTEYVILREDDILTIIKERK